MVRGAGEGKFSSQDGDVPGSQVGPQAGPGYHHKKIEGDLIMAWKELSIEELAEELGANISEIREKQRLVKLIVKTRKAKKLSQASLAKMIGIRPASPRSSQGSALRRSRSMCCSTC